MVKLIGTDYLLTLNKATRSKPGTAPMDAALEGTLNPDGTHLITSENPYSPDGAERPTFARCSVNAMITGHDETVLIWCDLPLRSIDALATSNGRTIVGPLGQGSVVLNPDHGLNTATATVAPGNYATKEQLSAAVDAAAQVAHNPQEASGEPAGA